MNKTASEPVVVRTTKQHTAYRFGLVARSHANLNKIAQTMIENNNTTPAAFASIAKLSERTELDKGHLYRLLKDRAGFCKVTYIGTQRHTGYFYEPDFYKSAQEQDNCAYPTHTGLLWVKDKWPAEIVIQSKIKEQTIFEEVAPSEHDQYLVTYRGKSPKGLPMTVETVKVTESRLVPLIEALPAYTGQIVIDVRKALEEIRNGRKANLGALHDDLVTLASMIRWLSEATDPEWSLLVHDILSTLPAIKETS